MVGVAGQEPLEDSPSRDSGASLSGNGPEAQWASPGWGPRCGNFAAPSCKESSKDQIDDRKADNGASIFLERFVYFF